MKILIATDGSEFSQAAIEKTCELIRRPKDTEVMIVSVCELPILAAEPYVTPANYYQIASENAEALAAGYVEKAQKLLRGRFPDLSITEKVIIGFANQGIVEIAEEWKPDLIVVGSHGRGFWSRAMLGSVSDAVVRHAPCSVLVVRDSKAGVPQ